MPSAKVGVVAVRKETINSSSGSAAPRRFSSSSQRTFHCWQHPEDAPTWTVAYGKEFWRQRQTQNLRLQPSTKATEAAIKLPSSVNLGDVIERVSHALAADADEGYPHVRAKTYAASFDEHGLRFSPYRSATTSGEKAPFARGFPEPDSSTEAVFRTVSIHRENQSFYSPGASTLDWSVLGNTAQALLEPGLDLVEHFEARSEGVAVTWVVSKPLAGTGPLLVEAELKGLDYCGQTESGHHFADATGTARLRVGNVKVVDAAGASWDAAMEVNENQLRFTVPEAILAQATYPLAIDPVIGTEFGIDAPVFVPAAGNQSTPAVASNGSDYLVVWQNVPTRTFILQGSRVNSVGTPLDPAGITISSTATVSQEASLGVAANGSDYLVVWQDSRNISTNSQDIYGARVSSTGLLLDTNGIAISRAMNTQSYPAVAASGNGYLVVWQDARNGFSNTDVYGARVTASGVLVETNGIVISNAPNNQNAPAVAANGGDFLVVWEDWRNFASRSDIYGARVNNSGLVLESNGIAISQSPVFQSVPAVAANGTDYLVVWQDYRNLNNYDIHGARVTASGDVVETNGIAISRAASAQLAPAVAASGTDYLVVWQDLRNGVPDVYGTRITNAGIVVETNGTAISRAINTQSAPAVAANGSGYLVVWQDARNGEANTEIFGARLTPSGALIETNGLVISSIVNNEAVPAVAFNGTNYLVVWTDSRNWTNKLFNLDIYGARVSNAGTVFDPNGIAICRATADQAAPAVATDGSNFLVVWQDLRNQSTTATDVYGARVTGTGALMETNGIAISRAANNQTSPSVAASRSGFLVVWQDMRNASIGSDIYGARLTTAGAVLDSGGIPINRAKDDQRFPAAAFNGNNFLVVWEDWRNSKPATTNGADIYGTLITMAGTTVDTNGFAISRTEKNQLFPAIAANGLPSNMNGYLVVWQDARNTSTSGYDIYGARVSLAGDILDTNGIAISTATNDQTFPSVASDGNDYLVAWQDATYSGTTRAVTNLNIYGTRVTSGGIVLDKSGLAINTNAFNQQLPVIAFGGGEQFLVVNQGTRFGTNRTVGNFVFLNVPPVAQSQSLSVNEDTPLTITLTASDADGDPLTYSVVTPPTHGTLTGTPPNLIYLGFTNYNGTDSFTFKANDGKVDSGIATIHITVLPVNDPPVAVARAFPLISLSPDDTNDFVISRNNTNAVVYFDGSLSTDVENDPLQFFWFEDGATTSFATSVVASNILSVGSHTIMLVVSDGMDAGTNRIVVNVIAASEAVQKLIDLVNGSRLPHQDTHPLIVTLNAASNSFDRGNGTAGINQLEAFQNKVRAQISPDDPALADLLIQAAQNIIDAFGESSEQPGIVRLGRQSLGGFHLQIAGNRGRVHLLQASTNLVDWETVGVARDTGNGKYEFEDPEASRFVSRFYRVVSP
ncbi:MAG: cadherin-like domain-containing protein [Verrucomicrobia bacterium]|nr:cadherin-like domain-containing protein [Verrucomicrobiota bacterium]